MAVVKCLSGTSGCDPLLEKFFRNLPLKDLFNGKRVGLLIEKHDIRVSLKLHLENKAKIYVVGSMFRTLINIVESLLAERRNGENTA